MKYLSIRPQAPELFLVGDAGKVVVQIEEPPPTARQPDLTAAWAAIMNDYREAPK